MHAGCGMTVLRQLVAVRNLKFHDDNHILFKKSLIGTHFYYSGDTCLQDSPATAFQIEKNLGRSMASSTPSCRCFDALPAALSVPRSNVASSTFQPGKTFYFYLHKIHLNFVRIILRVIFRLTALLLSGNLRLKACWQVFVPYVVPLISQIGFQRTQEKK